MAIGKKRSGQHRVIGQASDSAKAEKKRIAAQLAQKAAQENIAANRQLETARAHAATPGRADAQLTRAQLISAPTPSRLKDRQKHDREMQAEKLAHSASESKLAREHQSAENRLARENQLHMQDISLWNQRQMNTERLNQQNRQAELDREFREKLNERGIAAQKERDAALHGYNKERDEANRAHDKAMKEAQIAAQKERDKTLHSYDMEKDEERRKSDLANRYLILDYEEQQRIDAENAQYGIPKDSGISAEDRAKIINSKGAYKFEWSRTKEEEDKIKGYEEQINSPKATEEDKARLRRELDEYKAAHPPKGKAVETPVEERAPQTTVIGGVTYMNNNGKWEPVQTPKQEAPVPTEPQIITREDGTKWLGNGKGGFTPYTDPKDAARQKYMQDLLKKEVALKEKDDEGNAKTRPLTPQEIAEEMARYDEVVLGKKKTSSVTQRVNPVTGLMEVAFNGAPTNPMAGGSEAQPPSVAPTPTPENTAVMPPNEKGESAIIDSTGNAIGYVDAQGVKWKIIYGQNGKPMGKVPMQ